VDRLHDLDTLREDLDRLHLEIAAAKVRDVREGRYHDGRGAVVQVLGRRRS
jgi:hypothetical protein